MEEQKQVILQRKQPIPFIVNYPYGSANNKEYQFMGTTGKRISERPVPMEVFEWLKQYTTTFSSGELIIKPTDDEEIKYIAETIDNIEQAEKSAFTKEEITEVLTKGNHLSLKKALGEMTKDKTDDLKKNIHRQVITVAEELGIDSSAKRKVICEWAGLDEELADVLFENNAE